MVHFFFRRKPGKVGSTLNQTNKLCQVVNKQTIQTEPACRLNCGANLASHKKQTIIFNIDQFYQEPVQMLRDFPQIWHLLSLVFMKLMLLHNW